MRRTSTRVFVWLALGLLVLLGVQLVEASFHTHAALDGCAPCRVLSLCRALELPSAAFATPAATSFAMLFVEEAVESNSCPIPAAGRAPPTV